MRVYYYFDPERKGNDAVEGNFDVLEDVLQNRRIKLSSISGLNDPFDCQVSFCSQESSKYIDSFNEKFAELDNIIGIVCFSESVDNLLMWSHYAAQHRGCALGLDIDDELLTQVRYSSVAPKLVSGYCDDNNPYYRNAVYDILRTKSLEWAYEKEWRGVFLYSDKQYIEDCGTLKFFKFESSHIRSIFLGLKCKLRQDRMASLLHKAGLDFVKVYKMDKSPTGYALSCKPRMTGEEYRKRQEQIKTAIMMLFRSKT